MNPYAIQQQQQQQMPSASNLNNNDPWSQPSPMQTQNTTSQWQQAQAQATNLQQDPAQAQQQQMQQLQSLGSNFLQKGAMAAGSAFLSGTMSSGAEYSSVQDNFSAADTGMTYNRSDFDLENEPPLLEELGINIPHIWAKTKAVILPYRKLTGNTIHMDPSMIVEDADLAGPLMFALALGGELLITGKMHFGYIYGFGLFGCLSMTLVLNLMTPKEAISIWTVTSILGYSLLPVNILALVKILVVNIIRLETFGRILALMAVAWSTMASVRLLEVGCGMRDQRYLVGYPIALLYSAFVLMTIF